MAMQGGSVGLGNGVTAPKGRYVPRLLPFLGCFLAVGLLFALQQWLGARVMMPKMVWKLLPAIGAWELQYLLWGIFSWLLWYWYGEKLQKAGWRYLLTRILPLSIVLSVVVEMALAACFPQFPMSKVHLSFWRRLDYSLAEEFLENTAIFWAAFAIVRGMGHYRELRERERAMSELAVELAEARMMALRMQINPHFLFNTMNAISSLMYTDVRAADRMMEQLSNMLRVTLERGSQQMIRLREEMEFIEMYLALQDIRSSDRVQQQISVDPHLYDAMVPAMLLQPLVENAYVHGLSKISNRGLIEITAKPENNNIRVSVRNRGVGLNGPERPEGHRSAIGLNNVKSRLRLHFGEEGNLELRELDSDMVEAVITFPICFASSTESATPPHAESKVLYQI